MESVMEKEREKARERERGDMCGGLIQESTDKE